MNCPICGKKMEVHAVRTTFDKDRQEYQRTSYRCKQDNTWGMMEIPKSLIPEDQRIEAIIK
jgi:hypothetical protein